MQFYWRPSLRDYLSRYEKRIVQFGMYNWVEESTTEKIEVGIFCQLFWMRWMEKLIRICTLFILRIARRKRNWYFLFCHDFYVLINASNDDNCHRKTLILVVVRQAKRIILLYIYNKSCILFMFFYYESSENYFALLSVHSLWRFFRNFNFFYQQEKRGKKWNDLDLCFLVLSV